jgi:class 3 adenylate cyclase
MPSDEIVPKPLLAHIVDTKLNDFAAIRGDSNVIVNHFLPNTLFDREASVRARELTDTIARLQVEIEEKVAALRKERDDSETKALKIAELETTIAHLKERGGLTLLLTRVNQAAQNELLKSAEFHANFLGTEPCNMFVMSVDIRRSTELMLKARTPRGFATFITELCRDLENIVKECFGVFDKFTGDGILAFFPEFFSGDDAAFYALDAAVRCHAAFNAKYREFRSSFSAILNDVGLGIGIDYGPANLAQMAGGLTVVGVPVVYACRLGGAPAGKTLLNQPAYEKIMEQLSAVCFLRETELDLKHEGKALAYEVTRNAREYAPRPPAWLVKNS